MENTQLVFNLKIIASEGVVKPDTKDKVREWLSPPLSKPNTAARVHKNGIWPFSRYEWAVWSPFADEDIGMNGDDAVLSGDEVTEEEATAEADKALKKLIAAAEAANT